VTDCLWLGDRLCENVEFLPAADQVFCLQEGVKIRDIGLRRERGVPDGHGRTRAHRTVFRLLHKGSCAYQGLWGHTHRLREGLEGRPLEAGARLRPLSTVRFGSLAASASCSWLQTQLWRRRRMVSRSACTDRPSIYGPSDDVSTSSW
jgi:hypothetical protein